MAKETLIERMRRGVAVADGAMGTRLAEAGLPPGGCSAAWNRDRPDVVEGIHSEYREAGCELITTNTFGGSGEMLRRHGMDDRVEELNHAGAEIAVRAARGRAWVLGDIGPFGGFLAPLDEMTPEQAQEMFTTQASALSAGGADGVIVETMSDPGELAAAVRAARSVGSWPVFATYAFQRAGDGFATMMGTGVPCAIECALEAGADAVGANCGTDLSLDDYARLGNVLLQAVADRAPVILQPNAGSPHHTAQGPVYDATPEQMAGLARRLAAAGVRIIGGCCGTDARIMRAVVDAVVSRENG